MIFFWCAMLRHSPADETRCTFLRTFGRSFSMATLLQKKLTLFEKKRTGFEKKLALEVKKLYAF